jgi:hypothetical protein
MSGVVYAVSPETPLDAIPCNTSAAWIRSRADPTGGEHGTVACHRDASWDVLSVVELGLVDHRRRFKLSAHSRASTA